MNGNSIHLLAIFAALLATVGTAAAGGSLAGKWQTPKGDRVEISLDTNGNAIGFVTQPSPDGFGNKFPTNVLFIKGMTLEGRQAVGVMRTRETGGRDSFTIEGATAGTLSEDGNQLPLYWTPKRYREVPSGDFIELEYVKDEAPFQIVLARSTEPVVTDVRLYIVGRTGLHPVKALVEGAPMVAEAVWNRPPPTNHAPLQLTAKAGVLSLPSVPRSPGTNVFITPVFVPKLRQTNAPNEGIEGPPRGRQ